MAQGASSHPTGAAVLSDISALSYGYAYDHKKMRQYDKPLFTNDVTIKVFVSSNNKTHLDKIALINLQESYETANYFYRIGQANVGELKNVLESDLRGKVFVATI